MLPFRLTDVSRVEFYKRDELTTDLICCEVTASDGVVHFSHEEAASWNVLLEALQALPDFDSDWFAKVSQPAFAEFRTRAFERR